MVMHQSVSATVVVRYLAIRLDKGSWYIVYVACLLVVNSSCDKKFSWIMEGIHQFVTMPTNSPIFHTNGETVNCG